jgi:hypothetical protein
VNPIRLALLFVALQVFAPASGPLRVLRVTPTGPANPDDPVTVTFDRPVAGGLDATVDAASIFRIAPAVPGKVEWRDPVTLRFTPASPFEPGASYTITIAATFEAMDGSRLAAPFEHTFRVSPPRVLAGWPVGERSAAKHLPERPVFKLLVSSPVEPGALARLSQVRLDARCGGGSVPLRAVGIRKVGDTDPGNFRYIGYVGPYPQDTARDLRRVIELEPATPLPLACSAELRVPQAVDAASPGRHAWRFSTYGPFRMTAAACTGGKWCATGPARVEFSTPVRGSEVLRHVRIEPNVAFTVRDTAEEAATWVLEARLAPRQHYAIVVDSAIRDVFGQRFEGVGVRAFATTGYAPSVAYEFGKLLVEREGLRTLAVQHVNVDSLEVTAAPVPDSLLAAFLGQSWGWQEPWQAVVKGARRWTVPVVGGVDERRVTGVRLPTAEEVGGGFGPLLAVQVAGVSRDSTAPGHRPIALVQVTDLAVHVRLGADQAAVWVTGVSDGLPREGAEVVLHDAQGKVRATGRTDARGLALLDRLPPLADECGGWGCGGLEGYVVASLGKDRAIVGVTAYDPDLAPWRFGARSAWGPEREPVAAGVFTERGIYRPGEAVHAKAIVREGTLGALRVPPAGDSLRWVFRDREGGILEEATVPLGDFGTADRAVKLGPDLPLGYYRVEAQLRRNGEWRTVASADYQVAEYRPPEFLVDVESDASPRLAGDSLEVHVGARYLFGAPMADAPVRWVVRQRPVSPWELEIPGTEGYSIGSGYDWWDDSPGEGTRVTGEGVDTLDATGRLDLRLVVPEPAAGRPARVDVVATVTDANRQTVSAATSLTVHPASFYIAAKPRGDRYFWTAGSPVTLDLLAVRPEGERVEGVAVRGAVVRREWHRVRRIRGGEVEYIGAWVADTVATCDVVTGREPVACGFTPPAGGAYVVTLTATDAKGRTATTRFTRWAAGEDWVPWNDDSQLRMDVIPDRERYAVGDTATILLASPFTDAEAWVTVERERVLESRRIRLSSGATTLKLPITEAHAPNAFVSVVVVRGRSAAPGPLDDPGRPTLRVGYAELRVTPEVKRLAVEVRPERPEYRPGDTARIRLAVRDAAGRGRKAEVTLWAVDEGVLALTGYRTPDPIDLLYPPRGLGMRLASNLVAVAAQVPDGQKGRREPGGGGGADLAGILRSRFQTTAFFLGSVVTAEDGTATATAQLPDNLTTFRVMAVAVTAGDRYGSGESELLVSRPLLARPALPRFVREGDRFEAGVVVNSRLSGERKVTVKAEARGIRLEGKSKRDERVRPGRGIEARFGFTAIAGDSARFRFAVSADKEADAVAVAVPVRPFYHPLAQTIAGVLHDTASATFALGADVDPTRSTLEIHVGTSPLAILSGARREMEIYPYFCTEQIMSGALPLIALFRATGEPRMATQIETAVRTLSRRQRPDGGIGYWSSSDWTSPWLSAYAGRVLLEAREAGIAVSDTVLSRLADYLARSLREPLEARFAVARWHEQLGNTLAERLAAADFLSRLGRPDIAAENSLLAQAPRMHWEDRVLLAEVLARRGRSAEARLLLAHALEGVRIEGRTAVLPDSAVGGHYFGSRARPAARLLDALLAIDPANPVVGPLVETLVSRGRVEATRFWNTQDYGFATLALMNFERLGRAAGSTRVRVEAGGRRVLDVASAATSPRDTTLSLAGLIERGDDGRPVARVRLQGDGGGPVFYFLTVREAPKAPQLQPVDRGIQVERWYEDVRTGQPITSVAEGELVRVRLRVTVPAERNFVVVDDPLPAGLEPVDLSLRTVSPFGGEEALTGEMYAEQGGGWAYGSWDSGLWSPFDHKEMRDDRVVYSATVLWKGSHTATYLARATTAGTFLYPPAHAEEMYNPGVNGRSGGGTFTVTKGGR